jgi:predicted Zn-dependent peptidase
MGVDRSRLPAVGTDPPFALPAIARHVLPNGLRLRTVEHPTVPVVTFTLLIDGGSAADPEGLEGLAALTSDLADEGTGALDAIAVSDALARIGGDYDVEIAADGSVLALTTLARFARRGAALLADMAARPAHREADFDRVRQLRLDRLRQLKDLPAAVAERALLRLLYGRHPYGHLAIGHEAALERVTLGDVTAFHARSYQPSTATLVACGALSHGELRDHVEAAFGDWPGAGDAPARTAAAGRAPEAVSGARLVVVPREGAPQSELRIGRLTTGRDSPDHAALLVLNAVVGGQFVSRVNLKLREEKGYTYGARTSFDWRRRFSPFVLQTSVDTAATADAIACALAELGDVGGARPPGEDELASAKASLTRGFPRSFETAQQVARAVTQLALYGLPDSYFSDFVPAVNAVTAEEVVQAARQYLDPRAFTTLVVGDRAAIAVSLAGLALGEPVVLSHEA